MKLLTAISSADALRPNKATQKAKAEWLMQLEGEFAEMMGKPVPELEDGTQAGTVEDVDLLVPYPYDQAYILFLAAQIDARANHDADLYTADKQMADDAISSAKAWYRRNNRPENSGQWKGL